MAKVPVKPTDSFSKFVEYIEQLQNESEYPLWYRGCGLATHRLVPGLYRHGKIVSIDQLAKLEHGLFVRFQQRSLPFLANRPGDMWEMMFLMQHYRVPTRLLDWSENPFVALYFALTTAPMKFNRAREPRFSSAAVWVLNPTLWNHRALSHQTFTGGVLAPGDQPLKGYAPKADADFNAMNNFPVALYGSHNSPRIVAQRGVFTVFGQKTQPMESVYHKDNFPAGSLVKLELEALHVPKLRKAIFSYGITESVVFPDLDGLAREIRRCFEFEV